VEKWKESKEIVVREIIVVDYRRIMDDTRPMDVCPARISLLRNPYKNPVKIPCLSHTVASQWHGESWGESLGESSAAPGDSWRFLGIL